MTQVWVNNYTALLTAALAAVDTVMEVTSAPTITLGVDEYLLMTLEDANNPARVEIVKVTAIAGDVLTIVRGQENTLAQAYLLDDIVQGRMTAGTLDGMLQKVGGDMSGVIDMGGNWITGLPTGDPPAGDHAVSSNYANKKEPVITGLLNGGEISLSSSTEILVAEGFGDIIDPYTDQDNPATTQVGWATQVITVPGLTTDGSTHVFINELGDVEFRTGRLTPTETRTLIRLGLAYHSTGQLVSVYAEPNVTSQNGPLLYDFINFVSNTARINGGFVKPQPAGNLKLVRDLVSSFVPGGSWFVNREDPNTREYPIADPALMRYVDRDGVLTDGLGGQTDLVDPTRWDNNGVVETVPNPGSRTTIQYLFMMPSGNHLIQWGQEVYSNLAAAVDASGQDLAEFVPALGSDDGFLLAQILVEKGASDLTNAGQAQIFNTRVGYSGGSSSGLYVLRSGDAMTGELMLPGVPVDPLAATDKTYVDDADGILAGDISTNAGNISTNTGDISTNAGNISTNTGNIGINAGNISTNAGNISDNASDIVTNASAITNLGNTKLNLTGGTLTGPLGTTSTINATNGGITSGSTPLAADAGIAVLNQHGGFQLNVSEGFLGLGAIFQLNNLGGFDAYAMQFERNGPTHFFHAGTHIGGTSAEGLVGGAIGLTAGGLRCLSSGGSMRQAVDSTGTTWFQQQTTAGVHEAHIMRFIKDAYIEFYDAGRIELRTDQEGILVGHHTYNLDQGVKVLNALGGVELYNNGPTGNGGILQTSATGVYEKTWMDFTRDGQCQMFNDNLHVASTTSSGFEVHGKLVATAPTAENYAAQFVQPDGAPIYNIVDVVLGTTVVGGWSTVGRVMSWGPLEDLSASDERTKTDMVDIPYGLDTILALKPIRFKYKDEFALGPNHHRLGFGANHSRLVCDDLHYELKDDRMPDGVRHGVQESSVVPILVRAVQELTARVEALGG